MANGIRTGDPRGFNKGRSSNFVKVPEFNKHLKNARGHIGRNVVEITIKMKTIVRKQVYWVLRWVTTKKSKYWDQSLVTLILVTII